jgi:hypothetical protein
MKKSSREYVDVVKVPPAYLSAGFRTAAYEERVELRRGGNEQLVLASER